MFFRMKTVLGSAALLLASSGLASAASAATYSNNFANLGTQGYPGGGGYFFFAGDQAIQTFTGTGLAAVSNFAIVLNGGNNGNYATQPLGITFSINGTDVGSTTFNPGEQMPRALNFSFGAVAGMGTDYTLRAYVTQPVCGGCGAVQFSTNNPFTLASAAVPEPAAWGLMILGFGAVGGAMRANRRKAGVTFGFAR